MRAVLLFVALAVPALLPAQLVRGRVLEGGGTPIPRAMVELRLPTGQVANRGVTGATGAFAINAPTAGRYTIRVAAIGYTPHLSPPFTVSGEGVGYGDIRLARVAVTLAELQVLGTSRCGTGGTGSAVLTRLLEGARTSLDVMGGTLASSDGFRVEMVHRQALATRRDSVISADTTAAALMRWPIESIDPDSIKWLGFMVPGEFAGGDAGHLWFGPDVRVLFAEWFLESHCFRVERRASDTTAITVVFDPVVERNRVDIGGTMVLDPNTLALRRLTFEHRNLPRPFRVGMAGGELRFAELPSGTWLPMSWRIFAPILSASTGGAIGSDERSGRVLGVGGDTGRVPGPPTRRARALQMRVPRENLAPPDSLTDVSRYLAAINAACPHPAPRDRNTLFADERRLAAMVTGSNPSADDWHALACVRALLDADEASGREGLLMPLGTGWQEGATSAWLQALERDSVHLASAEGLAVLALDQAFPRKGNEVRVALARAVNAGITAPVAVRGCALMTVRAIELPASNACVLVGLEGGGDSTWQLLHLARLAARGADTLLVSTLLEAALKSAHDDPAWSEVGWHLRWFTEPEEWREWEELESVARPGWVRDRLASRDVRDGRRPGARLVEHFRRLDHAEAEYMRDVPRPQRGRLAMAATPEQKLDATYIDFDAMRFTSVPENVSARPTRFHRPWSPWLDDRGSVYVRFGAPTKTATSRSTAEKNYNQREAWLYQLSDESLVLQFEGEYFDGSPEPARLVAGVLGNYLCDMDATRCALLRKLSCFPPPPGMFCSKTDAEYSPLRIEEVAQLQQADEALIAIATTRDDNAPRPAHAIRTVAQFSRVWDPKSGAPLAVIPYAFRLGDVERDADSSGVTATLNLALRQWSSVTGSWTSTDFQRRLRFTGRLSDNAHLTGYSVVPSAENVTAWSLFAVQGSDRGGRAWGDRMIPLTPGELTMSDLVIGAESQGQTWTTTGGTEVPLGPLGAFDKNQPISLYWQVRSTSARESVRIAIAIFRSGPRDTERPVLELAFDGRLTAGLNEVQRNLGVAELDGGTYRVEVTMRDGAQVAVRSGRLLLR